MKKLLIVLSIVLISFAWLNADIYIKQNQHTDPINMMGQSQPAKDEVQEIWIGKNKMATHSKGMSLIMDIDKKVMNMINHGTKTYIPMDMPVDMTQYMPEQMAGMMKSMMGSITITVKPTGESKKIKNWNCNGYEVSMNVMGMQMKMMVWASTDVPFDWKMVTEKMLGSMMKTQMQLSDAAVKEMQKVQGFWILMEMNMSMMGADIKSKTEVVEITEKAAPSDAYAVPAGYQKKDKLSLEEMQRR